MRQVAWCGALWLAAVAIVAARPADQVPRTFTNLQVLPKAIAGGELVNMMKEFTFALGVRCEHCHEGGPELSTFDFAADTRPAKATARRMIRMMAALNGEWLEDVGDAARQPKVTCYTCHRGSRVPATTRPAGGGS